MIRVRRHAKLKLVLLSTLPSHRRGGRSGGFIMPFQRHLRLGLPSVTWPRRSRSDLRLFSRTVAHTRVCFANILLLQRTLDMKDRVGRVRVWSGRLTVETPGEAYFEEQGGSGHCGIKKVLASHVLAAVTVLWNHLETCLLSKRLSRIIIVCTHVRPTERGAYWRSSQSQSTSAIGTRGKDCMSR